jgi:hypothetical protein
LTILASIGVALFLPDRGHAQQLGTAVIMAEADATNAAISAQVAPGSLELDLNMTVLLSLKTVLTPLKQETASGSVIATNLRATTAPGETITLTAMTRGGTERSRDASPLAVTLTPGGSVGLRLTGEGLRPSTTYTGRIVLNALNESKQWTLTVTTIPRAALVAEDVGALQFVRPLWCGKGCELGTFRIRLTANAPTRQVLNLGVRLPATRTTPSEANVSNFTIDNFTFLPGTAPLDGSSRPPAGGGQAAAAATKTVAPESTKKVDPSGPDQKGQVAGGAGTGALSPTRTPEASAGESGRIPLPPTSLEGPVWYTATLRDLGAGAYTGKLVFDAAGALDESTTGSTMALNVRDHWLYPVALLILGSLLGWFSTKYLVAARKARTLAREVSLLRARANGLTRGDSTRKGWEFSKEATSYALLKARTLLDRLAALTASGLPMLVEEAELTRLKTETEARVGKLEDLRNTRMRVQPQADRRPSAQLAIGRLLRRATTLLEQPQFTAAQQTTFNELTQEILAWIDPQTQASKYADAILARLNEKTAVVVTSVAAPLQQHLTNLLNAWPNPGDVTGKPMPDLEVKDQIIGTVALLARDGTEPWAPALADGVAKGATLEQLFEIADEGFWQQLDSARPVIDGGGPLAVAPGEPVEIRLHVQDEQRFLKHPLQVIWTVTQNGRSTDIPTENLKLAHYFPSSGTAQVSAALTWRDRRIDVKNPKTITVQRDPAFDGRHLITQGGGIEFVAIAIAILFAVATAMQTQYDSTFGTASDYLALFLWAAGAAAGGNVLKQLGSDSTPGGVVDAQLP